MKNLDTLTSSYDYHLRKEQIAARPASPRDEAKLLVYDEATGKVSHHIFKELPALLPPASQLIFNESKVFPCRLMANKSSGGKAEIFLLSLHPEDGLYPVMIKSNGKKKVGDIYHLEDLIFEIIKKTEGTKIWVKINFEQEQLVKYIEEKGNVPIPPYIREGKSDEQDKQDYQTVYAKNQGSVAAPTAGLHFTHELMEQLKTSGIGAAFVNLHVGLGTFKPVDAEEILDHDMHTEFFEITSDNLAKLNLESPKYAVGTTSLRVLESTYTDDGYSHAEGETNIFLYPGVEVKSIAGLITNFHLPKSTLMMLVSSLIGREKTLELYQIAIDHNYRFYSYGDAMLIKRKK